MLRFAQCSPWRLLYQGSMKALGRCRRSVIASFRKSSSWVWTCSPTRTGRAYSEVHERWPDIGLMVTSGSSMFADSEPPDSWRVVAKPARPEVLIKVIEQ